jgi:outer membrane lipoprotein LolB
MAKSAAEISRRSRAAESHAAVHPLKPALGPTRILALAVLLLAVAGCSQKGIRVDDGSLPPDVARYRQELAAYDSWDLHARAVVRRPGEAYNIGLRWQRNPHRFVLLLEAPFGQGVFRIDANGNEDYRLSLPDGQQFSNRTPEALLDEVIGWSLPVSGMQYWIRGLPRPGADYRIQVDEFGSASSIRQDRWDIAITDYFDAGLEPRLPRRINLARDELSIRLVIERWQQSTAEQPSSDLFPDFD